jgi:hypothetical protein
VTERVRKERRDRFVLALRNMLRCFSDVAVLPISREPGVELLGNRPNPAPLRSDLGLSLVMNYTFQLEDRPRGGPKVVTWGYIYKVHGPSPTGEPLGPELFSYHYHPRDPASPAFPHLHVRCAPVAGVSVARAHFPTGFIELADVLRLLVRDFEVRPREQHEDPDNPQGYYEAVFAEAQQVFDELRD